MVCLYKFRRAGDAIGSVNSGEFNRFQANNPSERGVLDFANSQVNFRY